MKTAVSIPDDVLQKVDRFARRAKRSRSEVFSAALREYMARHAPDEVTDAINRAVDEIGDQHDDFVAAAARRILERNELLFRRARFFGLFSGADRVWSGIS